MTSLKNYYHLTKPGIIYGNAINATGGFLFASKGNINFLLLVQSLLGISLIIASGCVFNNYIDRRIDKNMSRTKKRALVTGKISTVRAISFGILLGVFGFILLAIYTNYLTVILGFIALFTYLVLYGYTKRHSIHGTLVGSISGALPPVAGYAAVSGRLDLAALLLFLTLVVWQMPHFYAIAIYRIKDYEAAGLPVLPLVKGIETTKKYILTYIFAFVLSSASFTYFGYLGYSYLTIILLISIFWLYVGIREFNKNNATKWSRKMFGTSLLVILAFSVMISLNAWLP